MALMDIAARTQCGLSAQIHRLARTALSLRTAVRWLGLRAGSCAIHDGTVEVPSDAEITCHGAEQASDPKRWRSKEAKEIVR
jgi:hypothetical protein